MYKNNHKKPKYNKKQLISSIDNVIYEKDLRGSKCYL